MTFLTKALLPLLLALSGPLLQAQANYDYIEESAEVNEFDVMGDDRYETVHYVEQSLNAILPMSVGSNMHADSINGSGFQPRNCMDGNMRTAWLTPANWKDAQLEFIINIQDDKKIKSATLVQISFFNGWRKDAQTWKDYARVKRLSLMINDQPYAEIMLADTYKQQFIAVDQLKIDKKRRYKFRFAVLETYPGAKYSQVGLSDVQFAGKVK